MRRNMSRLQGRDIIVAIIIIIVFITLSITLSVFNRKKKKISLMLYHIQIFRILNNMDSC